MARRRRPKGPPRCLDCGRPFKWIKSPHGWRRFEPRPVDGRTHVGAAAVPVEGGTYAWPSFRELVEDLMVRRQQGTAAAQAEAYDMPWYVPHTCHTAHTTTEDQQ